MRCVLLMLFLVFPVTAAPLSTDEILSALQSCVVNDEPTDDLVERLDEYSPKQLKSLLREYDKAWLPLRDKYLASFSKAAQEQASGSAKADTKRMVRKLREDFHSVRVKDEVAMKPLLKSQSMPALMQLRKLLMPTAAEILATSAEGLKKQRKIAVTLAGFRDAIVDSAIIPDEEDSEKKLLESEKSIAAQIGGLDRKGISIMEDNAKVVRQEKIPALEARGIRELNEWRLLLGQTALRIDPKLCDASRGHSEDMNRLNFFAHQSPVKGKESPSDRARAAGTTGGGENIFMGRPSPEAANQGWFFSPGHHKNMFRPGYQRIGLGQYEIHWTQMFG